MPTTKRGGVAALPMIVRFLGRTDGPCDDGPTAVCPHCGSDGRYVYEFLCDDGTVRGAMSGCLRLFPVSEIAAEDRRLVERAADLRKRFGAGATLNGFDTRIREALDAYYAGTMAREDALRVAKVEKAAMQLWRSRRGGRGRR